MHSPPKNCPLVLTVSLAAYIFIGCTESTVPMDEDPVDTADTDSESDTEPVDTADTASDTTSADVAPVHLVATDAAQYCVAPSEYSATSLQEALSHKAILRVLPGTYPLTEGEFMLPVEVTLRDGTVFSNPVDGALTTRAAPEDGETTSGYLYIFSQSISDSKGTPIVVGADFGVFQSGDTPPSSYTLDGTQMGYTFGAPLSNESYFRFHYSATEEASEPAYRLPGFGPCTDNNWMEQVSTVEFDGGQMTIRLAIGPHFYSTEPAVFTRATGTLDGVAFDQTDFFKLVYQPGHHHMIQDYAILFDSPIQGACGVMLEGFAADAPPSAVVHTINCDLSKIEDRTLTSK